MSRSAPTVASSQECTLSGSFPPLLSQLGASNRGEIGESAGVAPFVVVPAEYLHQVARGLCQAGVEHAGRWVADDVTRHEGIGAVTQHSGQAARGGLLEGAVDVLDRHLAADNSGEVG